MRLFHPQLHWVQHMFSSWTVMNWQRNVFFFRSMYRTAHILWDVGLQCTIQIFVQPSGKEFGECYVENGHNFSVKLWSTIRLPFWGLGWVYRIESGVSWHVNSTFMFDFYSHHGPILHCLSTIHKCNWWYIDVHIRLTLLLNGCTNMYPMSTAISGIIFNGG